MAKIVQTLTRASSEYEEDVAQSLIRDLDAVIEKLNTSFQQELKQEIETVSMLSPAVNETIIIKSLRVTNKSGSNTPTISITNNAFFIVNTQQLATNTSVEILTLPLIVEGGTILKYITAGTVSDGVDIGISYLNILKEVTT